MKYHSAIKLKDKHPNRNIIKMRCSLITIFELIAVYKCS